MLSIDTRSREPIYAQLEKQIVRLINLGVYETDSMLPSVRSLALELGINPNTVARAYKSLEQTGVIYTVAGKGAYVSSGNLNKIHSLALKNVEKALVDANNAGIDKGEVVALADKLWGVKND